MSVVFPNNNLPTSSQPWAREVTKQLSGIIASSTSSQINNAARDNQLNSSIIALSNVVTDVKIAADEANAAINGLIGLGSTGSSYTINASNINAGTISGNRISGGTISGVTFNTTGGTARIVLSGTTMSFVDDVGSTTGFIQTDGSYRGSFYLQGPGSASLSLSSDGAVFSSNGRDVMVNSQGIQFYGFVTAVNNMTVTGSNFSLPNITDSTAAANTRWGTTTGGRLFYITSARRAKHDIKDAQVNLEALNLRPRTWYDMNEYIENGNSTEGLVRIPGFVAEEVLEAGLEEFITYNEDGSVQGLSYDRMVAAVIPVIKYLNEQVEELKNEITILKGA
jgi:hypothetical protein